MVRTPQFLDKTQGDFVIMEEFVLFIEKVSKSIETKFMNACFV